MKGQNQTTMFEPSCEFTCFVFYVHIFVNLYVCIYMYERLFVFEEIMVKHVDNDSMSLCIKSTYTFHKWGT